MPNKPRIGFLRTGAVMGFLPDTPRNHTTAFLSELAGTFMFLFFSFAIAQVANTPPPASNTDTAPSVTKIFFIATGFGCSVAVNVWLFYRVSGGMFNPAVALTLFLVGAIPISRCTVVIVAQIVGGIAAAAAVSATLPGPMAVNVRLGGNCTVVRGLFIEMFCTLQLVFAVIMLAAVKHKATYLAPIGIGIALFIGHLCSVYYTGAGINPARAFGPDVVSHSFPGHHWIYWVGPVLGSLVAAAFFYLLEMFEWKTANPGQDYDDLETQVVTPGKKTVRPNVVLQAPLHQPAYYEKGNLYSSEPVSSQGAKTLQSGASDAVSPSYDGEQH
ncbi:aquaporin rerated protein [Exophiala viscosa]|uniref:aquaporin rerated protein n=1 Tax=Exophiala viscosa TaxID=2486360 RepID=UPI00219D1AF9|nr:aquaporin rerated protein [Exophiala viscosa]